eukprot:GHVU01111758.1.p1 GENE.GHVU01111758.1~~GHVU01111758.1.p1  ORF type:complete len:388 (+),score=37.44 GHVU01111758.1:242-1405(+)
MMVPCAFAEGKAVKVTCLLCEYEKKPLKTYGKLCYSAFRTHQDAAHPYLRDDSPHWCKFRKFEKFYADHGNDQEFRQLDPVRRARALFNAFKALQPQDVESPAAVDDAPVTIPSSFKVEVPSVLADGVLQRLYGDEPIGDTLLTRVSPTTYEVVIPNAKQLSLAQQYAAGGIAFEHVDAIAAASRVVNDAPTVEGTVHSKMVSKLVRLTAVLSMCVLSKLLAGCWCFCMALDGATISIGNSLLNVQVTLPVRGTIHTFHVAAIPTKLHTGKGLAKEVILILGSLDPNWTTRLLAQTSDGATNYFGHEDGLAANIARLVLKPFFVLWCGAHLCDLCINDAVFTCQTSGVWDPVTLGSLEFALALDPPVSPGIYLGYRRRRWLPDGRGS